MSLYYNVHVTLH